MLHSRHARIIASILLAFFLLYRAVLFYLKTFHGFAWDFSINWIAAHGLLSSLSVYDRAALQQLGSTLLDGGARQLFTGRFTSFIGLPTTAMLHLPFTLLPFDAGVQCYRVVALLAMLAAIAFTGLALPAAQRARAWLAGVLCLLTWHAFPQSLQLGQVDAWLLLLFAVMLLAVRREHWRVAGVAIGLATLLKISPGWLLLWCLLQRRWTALLAAAGTIAGGLLLSALPLRGRELVDFFMLVLPALGDSPLHVQNQSLSAFLARLATEDVQLLSFVAGTGGWKLVGAGVSLSLLFALHRRVQPLQDGLLPLATVILLALLAGPLTWDHYLAWAMIPVMLLAAQLSLCRCVLLAVLLLPMAFPVPYLAADVIAQGWWWRWLTGLQAMGLLALACWIIAGRVDFYPLAATMSFCTQHKKDDDYQQDQ